MRIGTVISEAKAKMWPHCKFNTYSAVIPIGNGRTASDRVTKSGHKYEFQIVRDWRIATVANTGLDRGRVKLR